MKTIIKWPGGKSGEIEKIEHLIPKYDRYIEPFFGGGAVFFNLMPSQAVINDISTMLIDFYKLVKAQDQALYNYLVAYGTSLQSLLEVAETNYEDILKAYHTIDEDQIVDLIQKIVSATTLSGDIILDLEYFKAILFKMVLDKFKRTNKNHEKQPFSDEDLKENLKTGFSSGFYMYFRDVYNDIALNRIKVNKSYSAANFYFIREYCYGSMFRYNARGEFNIPYGGISYNKKNFIAKIDSIFNSEIKRLFEHTEIYNTDFETLFNKINLDANDFIFLDPPYDTEFSDYEGRAFTKEDQKRLANALLHTPAKFILIIKNTDFIYDLYKDQFRILTFDKNYTYNVRSRNERNVKHLIITNIPE